MARELASTRAEETQLLANLRHDLRTPLTSIGGYAEAIADGTAAGPAASAAARTIAEETQRLERLVGELGVVERLRQGPSALRPEALDATTLLADAVARFDGRSAATGVALEVADEIPGDETRGFHRGPPGGRAHPAEPDRERPVGRSQGRTRLAASGAAAPARTARRGRHQRHRRWAGLPARNVGACLRTLLPGRSVALGSGLRAWAGHRSRAGAGPRRRGLGRERRAPHGAGSRSCCRSRRLPARTRRRPEPDPTPRGRRPYPSRVSEDIEPAAASGPSSPPPEITHLVRQRAEARARRDWPAADALKAQIEAAGWSVVDRGSVSSRPADVARQRRDGRRAALRLRGGRAVPPRRPGRMRPGPWRSWPARTPTAISRLLAGLRAHAPGRNPGRGVAQRPERRPGRGAGRGRSRTAHRSAAVRSRCCGRQCAWATPRR